MERRFSFRHVDVFTDTPFEGNPLAVFTDGRGLDGGTMQRIAREMNLSETVFILPPQDGALAALRIFTPAAELPFAGHPTLGAAFVLHATGRAAETPAAFVLEEGIGPVPVRIDCADPFTAWLTTPPISFGASFDDRAGMATALGLDAQGVRDGMPMQVVCAGNPFFYVALCDEAAVDRASLDVRALRRVVGDTAISGVYVFAVRPGGVYSRMFAPEHSIVEDPATGSATGPLAAYVLEHGLFAFTDPLELVAEQGTCMGRRSLLRIRVVGSGSARSIEVGGSAVGLIEGELRIE